MATTLVRPIQLLRGHGRSLRNKIMMKQIRWDEYSLKQAYEIMQDIFRGDDKPEEEETKEVEIDYSGETYGPFGSASF